MKLNAVPKQTAYRLTPYTPGVEAHIVSWYDKPENAEFFRRCPPICDWLSSASIQTVFSSMWIVYEGERPIGLAGLFSKDVYSRSCEFGLLIDAESCSSRGQAARAVFNQACDYVFNYLNFHKISIKLMPWRDKLAKRIEEHGFTKECDLRDSCYFRGEYHSEMLYSCLKLEFREIL
jgi:RimJ/RimL family protein N-acetyltransferase